MKNIIVILVIFSASINLMSQIDSDAGLIYPYTYDAIISYSSGNNAKFITDGNPETFWESANPLPYNYISAKDQNLFLDAYNFDIDGGQNKYLLAFDGNTDSKVDIKSKEVKITLKTNNPVRFLSFKYNSTDSLQITLIYADSSTEYEKYGNENNYQIISRNIDETKILKEIILSNASEYELFELAALNADLMEWVKFDLNETKEIGYLISRHLNWQGVDSIRLFYSNNDKNWIGLFNLNPSTVETVSELIDPEIYARYLLIRFYLSTQAYQKAKLRKFEIYDKYGPYGKPSQAYPSKNSWSESFGINTIWGWGYGLPSTMLKNESGSAKFNRLSNNARSYHRLDWDIKKPGDIPSFSIKYVNTDTTEVQWLNWKEEYGVWKENGFDIDACILFNNEYFPDHQWTDPYNQAFDYGEDFAEFFDKANKFVKLVEIGNEPWEYSKAVYKQILNGMSSGIRNGSKNIKTMPCGLQSFDKHSYLNNYLSDFIDDNTSVDALNTHIYSYIFNDEGERIAINPEDRRSETWSVNNLRKWAAKNKFPDAVYVTEFGYDSDGGNEDCTHSNCISEMEQAIYGVRQAMIFYRLGVKQFYWYFYANVDWESILHNRSGLVSSYKNGFSEKLSFKAFEFVYENMKDLHFNSIIEESDDLYSYSFADKNGKIKAIICWRPSSSNHEENIWTDIALTKDVKSVNQIINTEKKVAYKREVKKLKVALSGIPVIVHLR